MGHQLKLSSSDEPELTHDQWVLKIYKAYPRRVGYRVAIAAISKAIAETGEAYEDVLRHVTAYAKSVQGKEARYIPHPSTYFNQWRFMDDIEDSSGKIVVVPTPEEIEKNHVQAVINAVSRLHPHEQDSLKTKYPTLDGVIRAFPRGTGDLLQRIRKTLS